MEWAFTVLFLLMLWDLLGIDNRLHQVLAGCQRNFSQKERITVLPGKVEIERLFFSRVKGDCLAVYTTNAVAVM